jgi:hypothetical protein
MLPSSIRGKLMSSTLVHLVLEADRFLADLDERAPESTMSVSLKT